MAYTSWRGTVGLIKPLVGTGSLEDLIRILPEGIGIVPVHLGVQRGTQAEFESALPAYEKLVAELAEQEVDLIHPEGTPSFMLQGFRGEAALMKRWEKKYGIPMFTSGQTHVRALKAMGVKNFLHCSYSTWDESGVVAKYFKDAGLNPVKRIRILGTAAAKNEILSASKLSSHEVYAAVKKEFVKLKGVDGIYMQGSGWRVLDMLEPLEQDLGVPVIQTVPARSWDIQTRLHVRQPIAGHGRLLAEMPRP